MTREEARKNLIDIYELILLGDETKARTVEIDRENYKSYIKAIQMARQSLKTSRWKRFHIYMYGTYYECDSCGEEVEKKYDYCPNCGAKMEGVVCEK